ncbi:MAG TPA: LysR family transcriptional regulator [Dongiaceae bacterium]
MPDDNLSRLAALMAVARERSFTRAAKQLGVSPSALSHTIRTLETKVGLRLLNRTTRNVAPTEAGERLLQTVGPRIEEIEAAMLALGALRETPAGTVRLTATEYVAEAILWPAIATLLPNYPDLKVEIIIDYGLTNIVSERIDAGVRPGGTVARDMVAVPIGPDLRMAVAGAPSYFAGRRAPKMPQELMDHRCINLRLPSHGGLYAWEFERNGQELNVRVEGQLVFNTSTMMLRAALDGAGLVYLTEGQLQPYVDDGRLKRVLEDWCEPFSGYHLYYPSRRQPTAAFALLVETLRYRQPKPRPRLHR